MSNAPTPTMARATLAYPTSSSIVTGESKMQQLEEEVLKLRMDNIAKDRELRRLQAEIEQLRGEGFQTGNKRPCL